MSEAFVIDPVKLIISLQAWYPELERDFLVMQPAMGGSMLCLTHHEATYFSDGTFDKYREHHLAENIQLYDPIERSVCAAIYNCGLGIDLGLKEAMTKLFLKHYVDSGRLDKVFPEIRISMLRPKYRKSNLDALDLALGIKEKP